MVGRFLYPCTFLFALPSPTPTSPWSYTRAQRAGLVLLCGLIVGGYYLHDVLLERRTPFATTIDDEALRERVAALAHVPAPATVESTPSAESFSFDPNTVTTTDLQRLGLSEKQAAAFARYRDRRPFRKADEIRKLYVLRPEQAERLVQLAVLPAVPAATAEAVPTPPRQRFPFDPNTVSEDSLQLLGFTPREAAALLKYRSYRTPTFRSAGDLLKVRALDSQRVRALLPLVRITTEDTSGNVTFATTKLPPAAPPAVLDLNTASVEEFTSLPGIGQTRAARIVNYRDRLGGFIDVEQLAETYGLPDSVYQLIRSRLRVSTAIRPLSVNRLDAEALARHPYLDRRTAAILVRYRDQHGPFLSAADLENVRALSAEVRAKLLPYLNFDQ